MLLSVSPANHHLPVDCLQRRLRARRSSCESLCFRRSHRRDVKALSVEEELLAAEKEATAASAAAAAPAVSAAAQPPFVPPLPQSTSITPPYARRGDFGSALVRSAMRAATVSSSISSSTTVSSASFMSFDSDDDDDMHGVEQRLQWQQSPAMASLLAAHNAESTELRSFDAKKQYKGVCCSSASDRGADGR